MRHIAVASVLIVIIFSCTNRSRDQSNEVSTTRDTLVKFALPYRSLIVDDSNIVFYSMRRFDTSFLLNLQRTKSAVIGAYYQVVPTYHRDLDDYANDTSQLLFFEGFTFALKDSDWVTITHQIKRDMFRQEANRSNDVCLDCSKYILAYNYQTAYSGINNRKDFEAFAKFLHGSFLHGFMGKKRPLLR